MAHELEINQDGTVSMFYHGETPWHGLGTKVHEAPLSTDAIKLAGLDWEVKVQQMYIVDHLNNKLKMIPDKMVTVRQTDSQILGEVGYKFVPIQNHEAFAFMDELLGEGLRYETAGSLYGGKKVWLTARLPDANILGDKTVPYVVMINGHDGTTKAKVMITPVRVVCQNTLNLAINEATNAVSIMHMGDISKKVEEAKKVLQISSIYMYQLAKEADKLAMVKLNDDKIISIINQLLPLTDKAKEDDEKVKANMLQKREIFNCLKVDNLANHRNDAWGLINAVADFSDHYSVKKIKTVSRQNESRFEKIVNGHSLLNLAHHLVLQEA